MEAASPSSYPNKLVFHMCENTHQAAQYNHATVCYYDAAMDMAGMVAEGGSIT